jgi:hypothetical protein
MATPGTNRLFMIPFSEDLEVGAIPFFDLEKTPARDGTLDLVLHMAKRTGKRTSKTTVAPPRA